MPDLGDCDCQLGNPFQGDLWYFVQSDYCTPPCPSDLGLPISGKVIDARIGTGDVHDEIRGIRSACVCEIHKLAHDYTLHLEYHPQISDTLLARLCNRDTNCKLASLAFCLVTNTCLTTASDRSCFLIIGCKPKTVRVSSTFNNLYTITADFSVQNIITDGGFAAMLAGITDICVPTDAGSSDSSGYGIKPTDGAYTALGAYLGFNLAGSIKDAAGADIACILDSFDVTIDQGLKDKFDHDSMYKQQCIEGTLGMTGTCDISLDSGGDIHWVDVVNHNAFQFYL